MCTFILGVNSRLRCNFQPLHNLFISMSFLWLVDFRAVDWLDAYTLQFYDTHAAMRFWLPSVYLTYTHTRTYSGIAVQIWNVNGPAMQMHLNVQTAVKVFHVVVMLNKVMLSLWTCFVIFSIIKTELNALCGHLWYWCVWFVA